MDKQGCACCQCVHFIPDAVGDGKGLGECAKYEDYKATGASRAALESAYRRLGNKPFWGGDNGIYDRYCEKFEVGQNAVAVLTLGGSP